MVSIGFDRKSGVFRSLVEAHPSPRMPASSGCVPGRDVGSMKIFATLDKVAKTVRTKSFGPHVLPLHCWAILIISHPRARRQMLTIRS